MTNATVRTLVVLIATYPAVARSDCMSLASQRLDSNQSIRVLLSSRSPACISFTVQPGEAAQIAVDQPVDLQLKWASQGARMIIDSFEFGPESLTIEKAGPSQLTIEPIMPENSPISILITRKPVPLQVAALWRSAEDAATAAKRSGKVKDFASALELWRKLDDAPAVRRTYISGGEAAAATADLVSARSLFDKALDMCRSAADLRCSAAASNDAGWTAQQLGDFERALSLLNQAADGFQMLNDLKRQGQTLSNLGMLYRQTGDYRQAIGYYDRAGSLLRPRDRLANARVMNNLGVCYQFLAEYSRARIHFENQAECTRESEGGSICRD